MIKYGMKNYFTKTFKYLLSLKCNAHRLGNYVWPEQLNVCAKNGNLSDKNIRFIE